MAQERNRGLVLLFLLMCVIALVSAFQALYIERLLGAGRQAALAADRDTVSALVSVADFRTAQAGYVATGQQASYWMTHADGLATAIGDVITRESAATPSPDARAAFDEAGAALDDLRKMDSRARDVVKSDQKFVASDIIFIDSVQASSHLSKALYAAREADFAGREALLGRLAAVRLAAAGGGMAVILMGAWIFLARARQTAPVEAAAPVDTSRSILDAPSIAPRVAEAPAPPPAPMPVPVPALDVNLSAAAGLCTDLARVLDSRDVPALFERAATVLDAKGLVLWVADADGITMRPTLTHGYPEKVVARMGGLQLDGDNATALAFRSMQPQIVGAASASGAGALAVPLVTAGGCVGVLSAEVKKARPGQDTLSVAQMIAAQLSALVSPGEAAQARAQA